MTIWNYIIIGYFLVGLILAYIWWKDEYEPEYELLKELNEDNEEPMTILFLVALVLFWPFKIVKNYFESFLE